MAGIETLTTAGLPLRRRLEFWNDVACSTFSPIEADPLDLPQFCPSLTRGTVGGVRMASVLSSPSVVFHSQAHVARTAEPIFFLHLQVSGESINRQHGREAVLEPGDFTLFDNTRPYEMTFRAFNEVLVLTLPARLMQPHAGSLENSVAVPMRTSGAMNSLLSSFLREYWAYCKAEDDPLVAPLLAQSLLGLVTSAYLQLPQARSVRSRPKAARYSEMIRYIETHLGDPDLSPAAIATGCNVTPRYVHQIFAADDSTVHSVSSYIQGRRLEEAARLLSMPSMRNRTLTSIACHCGFNSLTHFGKVFRERFNNTPSEYRRLQLCVPPPQGDSQAEAEVFNGR